MIARKLKSSIKYIHDNGIFLFMLRLGPMPFRRIRDIFLSARIKAPDIYIGKSPKLNGLRNITIGRSFYAGDYLWLEAINHYGNTDFNPTIVIGDNVTVINHVHIGSTSQVVIGDDVLIGSRVTLIDHNHGIYQGTCQSSPLEPPVKRRLSCEKTITIGCNAWLGDGVVVLPGASIGAGSIIGANSVVTGMIPENCIAAGTPARPIRYYDATKEQWVKAEAFSRHILNMQ